ncbi:MAG: glycosyltransferase, partial [Proteobacteria bacterium]|nr:glycosyltransferase [Pseudomonadota bacterium]
MSSTEVSNGNPGVPAHGLRQPLTVVAAMLNEKENLKPWLENLEWADQIILVDHGSVDGSLEQARLQPNCHCISAPPGEGLIEDIRRLGIAEVSEGWVLIMDLDERVSGELKSEIEALVESDSTVCGYR